MNQKINPLTENHLFTKAFRNGASDVGRLCAVYVLKNIKRLPGGAPVPTKVGIAVNAKLGGAVQRNRVKRMIREAYRVHMGRVSPGKLIVISPRAAAFSGKLKTQAFTRALDVSFTNLGVYEGQTLKVRDKFAPQSDARKAPRRDKESAHGKGGAV